MKGRCYNKKQQAENKSTQYTPSVTDVGCDVFEERRRTRALGLDYDACIAYIQHPEESCNILENDSEPNSRKAPKALNPQKKTS